MKTESCYFEHFKFPTVLTRHVRCVKERDINRMRIERGDINRENEELGNSIHKKREKEKRKSSWGEKLNAGSLSSRFRSSEAEIHCVL